MSHVTRAGHYLGAFPSRANPKDLGFPAHLIRPGEFAPRAQLTGTIGHVKDQKQQGSCTAHGATSEGERLYRRWKGQSPIFSPAFHYYMERKIEGTLAQGDCGAAVNTSLIVAENGGSGFCLESFMPYNDSDYSTPPSALAIASGAEYPGGSYHSIGNVIANIKSCINSDYSFVIGIAVYDSFEDPKAAASGLIPLPNPGVESLDGYHEVHAGMAYDDTIQCPGAPHPGAVMFQNSWGTSWGIKCPISDDAGGFAWLAYDYLMSPTFTTDVRMQHLGKAW